MIEAIPGKVDPLLLPFIIQNDKFFDYAVSRSAGGLSPRVKWEHLKDYEFDLPPIEEQRILADKLWAAYRLKESYKKLLTATQEMVKSSVCLTKLLDSKFYIGVNTALNRFKNDFQYNFTGWNKSSVEARQKILLELVFDTWRINDLRLDRVK